MSSALSILKKYWGFSAFRPLQEDIVENVLAQKDALAVLPTGGGKSICYQVPGIALGGLCVVISPLIALMKDQVQNLQKIGVKAATIHSGMEPREIELLINNAQYGAIQFLYISPERLLSERFKKRLEQLPISMVAIDEAHCISQWGYDFRPAYLQIAEIKKQWPGIPFLALTASATPEVKKDIVEKLGLNDPGIFQASFARPNISFVVRHEENKAKKLLTILSRVPGTAVVYVRQRRRAKEIAKFLQQNKIRADYYHAGLDMEERSKKQEAWIRGNVRAIVSTNAFGMGIDKADVRHVVHMDIPESMEAYYQEAGRAGRDGKRAFATLLFNGNDIEQIEQRVLNDFPDLDFIRQTYTALMNYLRVPVGSGTNAMYEFDFAKFMNYYKAPAPRVLKALKLLEQEELFAISDATFLPAKIYFLTDKRTLYNFQVANERFDALIKFILRTHPGIFEEYVRIDVPKIARQTSWSVVSIEKQLKYLHQVGLIRYQSANQNPRILLLAAAQESKYLSLNKSFIAEREHVFKHQLESMLRYVKEDEYCRSRIILEYFGELDAQDCGICDYCLERKDMQKDELAKSALVLDIQNALQEQSLTASALKTVLGKIPEGRVNKTMRWLLDNGKVIKSANKYSWKE
ncbi:MAG: ATP-dependent DNA helicase RecQ [Chitinophagales bacterium]